VYPPGKSVVIKGLQSYKANSTTVNPVSRVAVQLGKIEAAELQRGSLLQGERDLPLSAQFDARINLFSPMKMKNLELPVHLGTLRVPALIIPLAIYESYSLVRIKPRSALPLRS